MNIPFLAPSSKPDNDNATASLDPWPFYPDLDDCKDLSWDESSMLEQFYIAPLDSKKYEPEGCCGTGRDSGKGEQRKKVA